MRINVNNSLSITGYVRTLQFHRIHSRSFSPNGLFLERNSDEELRDSAARALLNLSHSDAEVGDLRRAIATAQDFFAAEHTMRDVDALVNESFWQRLNLTVEAEFVIVSTGHGILNDSNAVILLKTEVEEAPSIDDI